LRTAQANSLRDSTSKITSPKWTGVMAQATEHLLASVKPGVQIPIPPKKKKKKLLLSKKKENSKMFSGKKKIK
jgi:hypothetical protein